MATSYLLSSCRQRRVVLHFSMCILLFAWPLYRANNITAIIQQDKERDHHIFHPNNLDTVKHVPCGEYKCFFRLKSYPNVGYLVAPSKRKKNVDFEWFETLQSGWKLAEELKEEYGIVHFLLEPPTKVKVTKELDKRLNKRLYSEKKQRTIRGRNAKRFPKGSTALIQKVKTAPKRSVVVGCTESKMDAFKKNMNDFVQSIKYTESFVHNFRQGIATIKKLLQDEPCLTKDFQVLVDERGHFFHLDFDRCFMPEDPGSKYEISEEEQKSCLKALDEISHRLERNLKR